MNIFLGEFALAQGKKGGQFYTPEGIGQIQVLTPLIEIQNKYEENARPIREIIELNNEQRTFVIHV